MPLLEATSAEAIPKLNAFERQELSNTAWAFATLGLQNVPLMNALSSEVRRRIELFDAQALANLADALPDCAEDLKQRLQPSLEALVAGMPGTLEGWRAGRFFEVLNQICADNFGAAGTQLLLEKMGVPFPAANFVLRGQHRVAQLLAETDMRLEVYGLAHKRVLCYGEWDLVLPSGERVHGATLRENGIRVGHVPAPAWLRSHATPINSMIGRDLCGEFQLITGIGLIIDAAPPGRLEGSVHLFSTSTPCVSCVGALRQLQLRLPGVNLTFANQELCK